MTQFDNPYANPYMDPMMQPRKTSGLAITALVFSLVGIIPCCFFAAPVGVILGIIAALLIGSNPLRKGKGLAWTAVVLGVLFSVLWTAGYFWSYQTFQKPINEGPRAAFVAGFAGDEPGFKSAFFGDASTASDADVEHFVTELKNRYGDYRNIHLDEPIAQQQMLDQMMSPLKELSYVFQFSNKVMKGTIESNLDGWSMKFGRIVILDPDAGDLVFPPGSKPSPVAGRKSRSSSGGAATTTTAPTSMPAADPDSADGG
jgi:hypothetical protein